MEETVPTRCGSMERMREIDLTLIPDNRIQGFERLDIRGSTAPSVHLSLNLLEVLNISDDSNELIVVRRASDSVDIGDGWTLLGTEEIGQAMFDVFQQGNAILKVQRAIEVNLELSLLTGNEMESDVIVVSGGSRLDRLCRSNRRRCRDR